jgi:hypothetical protein
MEIFKIVWRNWAEEFDKTWFLFGNFVVVFIKEMSKGKNLDFLLRLKLNLRFLFSNWEDLNFDLLVFPTKLFQQK